MDKNIKLVAFGIAMWVVPFLASFLFFDPATQKLTIDETFFKSIMIVLSSMLGAFLLVKYFEGVQTDFVKEGIVVGAAWLAINWVLDVIILLPMSKMDVATYFMQIGMRYLIAPAMSISMALAIENARKNINRQGE